MKEATPVNDFLNATVRILMAGAAFGMTVIPVVEQKVHENPALLPLGLILFALAYKFPTQQEFIDAKQNQPVEDERASTSFGETISS
jgi:hypothetical protein